MEQCPCLVLSYSACANRLVLTQISSACFCRENERSPTYYATEGRKGYLSHCGLFIFPCLHLTMSCGNRVQQRMISNPKKNT